MADAAGGVFLKPIKEYKRARSRSSSAQPPSISSASSNHDTPESSTASLDTLRPSTLSGRTLSSTSADLRPTTAPTSPTTTPPSEKQDITSSNSLPLPSSRRNSTSTQKSAPPPTSSSSSSAPTDQLTRTNNNNNNNTAAAMASASALSLGKFFLTGARGVLVDIPLAAAEGMRAVPRLYTSTPTSSARDAYGHVTDVRSGFAVAGRTFAHGVAEGFGDIFVETWRGKREEGAKGVAKGLGKGVVSLGMKTGAGVVGVLAYPGLGVCRSVRSMVKSEVRRGVESARWVEGEWLVAERAAGEEEGRGVVGGVDEVARAWERVVRGKGREGS
ncbi:hypothetical protein DBV05_g7342 [Lasiodiplodia theobromae]|uniref:Uncharacterized protein n=1 Tax=Lasiodiplodia theobromae TaxID=45133 RepID=A0A5N5D9H5_9PEZI|nr:hypothetical protein DBV05_g7342 [Lasiodiplodia theobromae]